MVTMKQYLISISLSTFLVAETQLYKRLCPSIRQSIGPLVCPSSRKVWKRDDVKTRWCWSHDCLCLWVSMGWVVNGWVLYVVWTEKKKEKEKKEKFTHVWKKKMIEKRKIKDWRLKRKKKNKWCGVTISLRTGGQPTPIHTQHPTQPLFQHRHTHKKLLKRSFSHFSTRSPRTNRPTNQPTDGRTKPLIELRVRN